MCGYRLGTWRWLSNDTALVDTASKIQSIDKAPRQTVSPAFHPGWRSHLTGRSETNNVRLEANSALHASLCGGPLSSEELTLKPCLRSFREIKTSPGRLPNLSLFREATEVGKCFEEGPENVAGRGIQQALGSLES